MTGAAKEAMKNKWIFLSCFCEHEIGTIYYDKTKTNWLSTTNRLNET